VDRESGALEAFETYVRKNGWELYYISALTGEGLHELIYGVNDRLQQLPPVAVYESEVATVETVTEGSHDISIRRENGKFVVEGEWIYNLMGRTNFDDFESLNYFQQTLLRFDVFKRLEEAGCRDGDTVSLYDFEFDYVK
jgi:Obg family GTPase CgtA, C-terminal extension